MAKKKPPARVKQILVSINNKRAQIVIEHILENGFITTEQLEKDYGYNHPPRAARDVREAGIPLETLRSRAFKNSVELPDFVKKILAKTISEK